MLNQRNLFLFSHKSKTFDCYYRMKSQKLLEEKMDNDS